MKILLIAVLALMVFGATNTFAGDIIAGGTVFNSNNDARGLLGYSVGNRVALRFAIDADADYMVGEVSAVIYFTPTKSNIEFGLIGGGGPAWFWNVKDLSWASQASGGFIGGVSITKSITLYASERYRGTTSDGYLRCWLTEVGFRLGI